MLATEGKSGANGSLLGMMLEQQESEAFSDHEILHEAAMFYGVRILTHHMYMPLITCV